MLIGKDLSDWEYYGEQIIVIKLKIDERVTEIYKKIFTLSSNKKHYKVSIPWGFPTDNSCYECGGSFDAGHDQINEIKCDLIRIEFAGYNIPSAVNWIDDNGIMINLCSFFPKDWLILPFEQELIDGLKRYKDKIEAAKAKAAMTKARTKEDKVKLQELIKSKLSSEELEMISFKKK